MRLYFVMVGNAKLRPDSWFGVLNLEILHFDINTMLDFDQVILRIGNRQDDRSIGVPEHAHIPIRTN